LSRALKACGFPRDRDYLQTRCLFISTFTLGHKKRIRSNRLSWRSRQHRCAVERSAEKVHVKLVKHHHHHLPLFCCFAQLVLRFSAQVSAASIVGGNRLRSRVSMRDVLTASLLTPRSWLPRPAVCSTAWSVAIWCSISATTSCS
jgi:hypothetical protein